MSRWKRAFFFALGWLFVGLAALGLVLPLLPTTPFLLLAGSCFLRSSPRWRRWLAESRWFGPALRDWDEHRAVRRPVKVLAVVVVSVVLCVALVRDVPRVVQVLVVVLGGVGLTVIWRLPTVPPSHPTPPAAPDPAAAEPPAPPPPQAPGPAEAPGGG